MAKKASIKYRITRIHDYNDKFLSKDIGLQILFIL